MPPISVIITTSPGREAHLLACLQMLSQQRQLPLEVIVVDDGSEQGASVAQSQIWPFELVYDWRNNDCRVALSRNRGAERAKGQLLVFIDSDILLNPLALEAYALFLDLKAHWLLYGYYGYHEELLTPSALLPGQTVQWCDRRYVEFNENQILPAPNLLRFPHEWAWSGNFALHRSLYRQIKGFDARYQGWGGEDLDFASRAIASGFELHFLLDAWGEHMPHALNEPFHALPSEQKSQIYLSHYTPSPYPVRVLSTPHGLKGLLKKIHGFYVPQTAYYQKGENGN